MTENNPENQEENNETSSEVNKQETMPSDLDKPSNDKPDGQAEKGGRVDNTEGEITEELSDQAKEIEAETDEDVDIEELAKEFQAVDEEPKPMPIQILITAGFILGPIMLILDIIFDRLFGPIGNGFTIVFGVITLVYFIIIFYKGWKLSKRIE